MSYSATEQARCEAREGNSIALVITPRQADLGDFSVRRALPARQRRMVGPFVFFDHFGPVEFPPGRGIAVRPHPHIGIATITYLFEGEIIHRDSLGAVQPIQPGAVNLMTAGRGIVHSERAGDDLNQVSRLHGIQSWIALPVEEEECEPDFTHYPAGELPRIELPGLRVSVIMGTFGGQQSPVRTYSRTLYLECEFEAEAEWRLPETEQELALYVVEGEIEIDGSRLGAGVMALACPDKVISVKARSTGRLMVIGGDALGERSVDWNFVHSSTERIAQAREDWREDRFPKVPGDSEMIPLPD